MKSKGIIVIVLVAFAGLFWQGFSAGKNQTTKKALQLAKSVEPGLTLREVSGERVVLDWVAPPLQPIYDSEGGPLTAIQMAGCDPVHEPGVVLLPGLTELLDALPGAASVSLVEAEYEPFDLGECLPMPEDFILDQRPSSSSPDPVWANESQREAVDMRERRLRTEKKAELWPTRIVELSESGVYRGHRLLALNLRPVQINTLTGQGRILKKARIQVIRPNSSNGEIRLPDRTNETKALRGMLGKLAETALPSRAPDHREGRDNQGLDDHDGPIYNVNSWRIYVRETSIVRLTGEYMHLAGVPIDQISPWDLHIYNKGREIPIVVEGQADGRFDLYDYIDFFGEKNEKTYVDVEPSLYQDPFTVENCYQLYWGDGQPGLRMGEENGSWQPTWNLELERSVRTKIHFERDRYFDRLGDSPQFLGQRLTRLGPLGLLQDNWFMDERVDALTSRDYEGFIPFPNPTPPFSFESVVVRACLTGFSATPGFNHYVTVSLNGLTDNGLTVGRQNSSDTAAVWGGQSPVIFQTKLGSASNNIQTEDLINGINTFTVTVPGNALSGTSDKILVNWFEVEYEKDMRSRNGEFRFDFNAPLRDTVGYDIRGFNTRNIQVWKLGQSRLTSLEVRRVTPADESASWAVRFPMIADAPHDVLVWGENYVFRPFAMVPDTISIDLRNNPGAEYVMIAYDPYFADTSLHILDSLRRINFHNSVLTVPLTEVYEQFSGGLSTPYAIRDFLKYAYDNWDVRPTHACLVGDAVLEQREGSIPGNQLPSFAPPTLEFGSASCDVLFGCVSGPDYDIIPDIAIGRISCRTPQELQTYVSKVLRYETNPDFEGMFQSNVLMISDIADPQFNFAAGFSEPTIQQLVDNQCVNVTRLYLDSIPDGQGPTRLRDELRNGCVVVNYNGHGGGGVWSGSRLIDVTGVRLLNNRETFPFITNFTCYVGAFDDRSQAAVLGEAFMFTRNNNNDVIGAIGFYSSSGVGWAVAGQSMQRKLFDFALAPPGYTLGEITQFNKARYWSALNQPVSFTSPYSMMMMMNLLGDPGVQLYVPREEIDPEIVGETNVITPHDTTADSTFQVSLTVPWEFSNDSLTRAYILPYNEELYKYRLDTLTGRVFRTLTSVHSPAFDPENVEFYDVFDRNWISPPISAPSFISPRGEVVVYLTDPILKRNAIGCFPVFLADSLASVQIFDVAPIPGPVLYNDVPFRVGATILHQNDIEYVRYRGVYTPAQGPIRLDTLNMLQVNPGFWQVPTLLGPYNLDGGSYRVKFFVKPFGENEFESEYFSLRLEVRPDFNLNFILSSSPGERGGRRPYYYQPIRVERSSVTGEIGDVKIRLHASRDSTYVTGGDTITVVLDSFTVETIMTTLGDGEAEQGAYIPTSFQPGRYEVSVMVDPDSVYDESSENNNRRDFVIQIPSYYSASRPRGTFQERPFQIGPHRYWSLAKNDTLYLQVPPNVLDRDSAAIGYTQPRTFSQAEVAVLSGQGLRQPFTQGSFGVFKAMFDDTVATLSDSMTAHVTLSIEGRDTLRSRVPVVPYQLYVKDPARDHWLAARNNEITRDSIGFVRAFPVPAQPSPLDTFVIWRLRATGDIPYIGEIGIFQRTDNRGPNVELAVGGLRYTKGALVPRNPQLYATFSDAAGVQRTPGTFYFVLDGDTLRDELIAWNDTSTSNSSLTALVEPDLDTGEHEVKIFATDNHGNTSSYVTQFEVRGDFGFEWAINYPNPFANNTTIAYVLTGVTDDFTQIKIYTVSGRLIRTLRETERATANYRTQQWDGRDEDGNEVANGVYFARVVAKQGEQTIEETVKLAKVRK
ncbi:MAG: T9SS type A sorting domain-containing protein [bacterium]|nr:T9SS type A sorting domain-containing protein [bacterium]